MDLLTAVAASMLPASRAVVSTAFNQLRHRRCTGPAFLELLWAASGKSCPLGGHDIARVMQWAEQAIAQAPRLAIEPVPVFDCRYPALLASTVDPPPVLWVRGQPGVLFRPAVAIVGSRAASPYAVQVGARIAAELADRGILVVSGLARGVDSAAHRGCLDAGGATVAVQGCGLDRVYPFEHSALAARIAESGAVVSELAAGAAPLPEHFPLRNRIISGISLATVVVEASEQSGSLITARCALDQGRDVMAVPGSVLSGRNRGSHALLKDGARVVETADDILQELGWTSAVPAGRPARLPVSEPVLAHMEPGETYGLDDLAAATGITSARLLARLTELELSGWVSSAGGRFVRRP
jgi:DNA processing protein